VVVQASAAVPGRVCGTTTSDCVIGFALASSQKNLNLEHRVQTPALAGASSAEAAAAEDGVALAVGGPADSVGAGLPPLRLSSGIPASPGQSPHAGGRSDGIDEAQRGGGGSGGAEAGSSPGRSDAVRSAMANTRTAELASLAEQADIR